MTKSDSIAKISGALAKAQRNIGAASKDAANPFFKSHYADLGSVMSVCKEPLLEQGISVLQLVGKDESGGYLETVLLHESGEFISDRMQLVCAKQNDPQAMGSAISYARRYALQSALFIPAVDDDGEAAMKPTRALQAQDQAITERQERREQEAETTRTTNRHTEEGQRVLNPHPVRNGSSDWRDARIHFGKDQGKQLGELSSKKLQWYANDWVDKKVSDTKFPPSAADTALVNALMAYKRTIQNGIKTMSEKITESKEEPDEIPF